MVQLEQLLLEAPLGFTGSCNALNQLAETDVDALLKLIAHVNCIFGGVTTHGDALSSSSKTDSQIRLNDSIEGENGGGNPKGRVRVQEKFSRELAVLEWLGRSLLHSAPMQPGQTKPSLNIKSIAKPLAKLLDAYTTLSKVVIEAFVLNFDPCNISEAEGKPTESTSDNETSKIDTLVRAGRLENLSWRVGLALASNTADKIASPYVQLKFFIRQPSGESKAHCVEMTYNEFRDFVVTFKEAALSMEIV
jgi:hypothetical protein